MNASEDSLLSRQRQVMMKSRSQESESRIQESEEKKICESGLPP
jgi:hypothetical protein